MTPGVEFAETLLTLGAAGLAVLVVGGLALRRVWRRRALGEWEGPAVDALEARVGDLEHQEARVAELEERLDFAERMLVARGEASAGRPREER